MEKLDIGGKKELEELKAARGEFKQWAEGEIEDASPDLAARLKLLIEHERDIPDGDFKLFLMHKTKEKDFDWEEYEPLEKKILEELQQKENNPRRVFYRLFSDKLRPRIAGTELGEEREKENL